MTREDLAHAARFAGLDLTPEHFEDLVTGYERIRGMLERMPIGRPRGDEPAHVFCPKTFMPKS